MSASPVSTRGWALDSLIKSSTNFRAVERVSASSDALLDVIRKHDRDGVPLVIQGFHKLEKWPAKLFTLEGFSGHSDSQEICVRNVHSRMDKIMDMGEFIATSRSLSQYADDGECERFYGKDAQCPDVWEQWLCKTGILPPYVLSCGPEDEFRFRPESSRVETLMCYLGVGDTYTPSHKDLCASSGQNLMCYTENNGSSFWFMTESSAAPEASSYFHELGQELDHEDHVVTLDDFSKAPFRVYALEQKLGDLVLVPPRSCHQVVNYGGITVKTSWSRMTLRGLSTAYHHELPIYRRVCRPETYRIKSTIHYALVGRTKELANRLLENEGQPNHLSFPENLANAINASTYNAQATPSHIEREAHSLLVAQTKQLVQIYDSILAEERPKPGIVVGRKLSLPGSFNDDNRIVCDFCECDIFQSFFECLRCKHSDRVSGHIVCPGCYAEGRSCPCLIMQPTQCRDFEVLDKTRSEAARVLENFDVWVDEHPATNFSIPKLFQAACVVLEMRKDTKRPMKSCTKARDPHEVPSAWGLHCRHCHRTTCFECILKIFKMHSTEALQLFDGDNSRGPYHEKHTLSGTRYKNSSDKLLHAQRLGTPVEGHLLLLHVTLKYTSCTPLNLKGMELGWYDAQAEQGNSGASPSKFAGHNMGMHQGTQLTIKIPPYQPLRNVQLHGIMKRSRAYVEIPPAPYSSHKKIRRTSWNDPHPLSEVNRHSVHLIPTLSPRHQALEMSHKSITPSEDISRGDNVADIKASSNTLLTRKKVSTKSVRPANRPSMISPLTYKENQDAKRATLARLSFKKICLPSPNEDGTAILTLDLIPDNSLASLTSPSDHDPTTLNPPSDGKCLEDWPSRGEPSITQLLAQIAGTSQSSQPDDPYVSATAR